MKNRVFSIVLILILIIVIPSVLFTVYELSSLRKNERIITEIYNNQLESMLNSINQYADDITRSWAEEINRYCFSDTFRQGELQHFFMLNNAVKNIFITDTSESEFTFFAPHESVINLPDKDTLKQMVVSNRKQIERLSAFMKSGYRKIEPLEKNPDAGNFIIIFVMNNPGKPLKICGIFIDPARFINETLSPRIQSGVQDRFVISAYHGDKEIYSSNIYARKRKVEFKKPLWLLAGFNLGIQMKDETIEELVRKRSVTNILLSIIMDIFLFSGAWFLYRNVRKETRLARIKSDFVSNVSHEIRTPLALINMFIETLELNRIRSEEQRKEYYEIIGQETRRLAGIVNKILNFSKIDSGNRKYRFENVNLNEIAGDVLHVYKYHLESQKFSYYFEPGSDLPSVTADAEAVTDAIINLIDNAVKYSLEKKEIHIRTGIRNHFVFIEVTDKGAGIPEKAQKFVFDKFYRVSEGSLAYKGKGTGLGLSIVRHIMDAHNGAVDLESKVGLGTTFRLDFPANKEQNNQKQ